MILEGIKWDGSVLGALLHAFNLDGHIEGSRYSSADGQRASPQLFDTAITARLTRRI